MKKAIQVAWISKQMGAWKWANSRGYYRVSVVDLDKLKTIKLFPFTYGKKLKKITRSYNAHISTIWESGDCTLSYPGGYWGYKKRYERAREIGKEEAKKNHCKYYEII